ncbi:MAG: TadE/TadG family type IV pilus assembly protein [Acidimicrobiales bacterium]
MTAHRELRARRDQKGAALVEFVFVLPFFVLILFGLISFGMILALKQGVTNASADAARSVVGTPVTSAAAGITKAQTTVTNRLSWLGGNAGYVVTDVKWWNGTSCVAVAAAVAPPSPATICVKVTYPYAAHKLVPLPTFGLSQLSSEARVQVAS